MAYLHDIPKFTFGTAFDVVPDYDLFEQDTALSGAQQQQKSYDNQPTSTNQFNPSSSSDKQSGAKLICHDNIRSTAANKDKRMTERKFKRLIRDAIRLGCRHFDCAPLYKTQHLMGQVLNDIIKNSIVPRQQFFITSKLPPNMMRPENIERSIINSIDELKVHYLDLFLIHAPFATKHNSQDDSDIYPKDPDTGETILDEDGQILENAWLKLVDLKRQGFTRYIGISNVNLEQLVRLNSLHHVDVVQNEYHIYNQDKELFDYCEEIDVHFEAYAAFGSPQRAREKGMPCVFTDPFVTRVARRHKLTPAQVIMQWIHQQPLSYVIRSDDLKQLEENLRAPRNYPISNNEMIDLDTLNKNVRIYLFDEHKGIEKHREYPFEVKSCDAQSNQDETKAISSSQMTTSAQNVPNFDYTKQTHVSSSTSGKCYYDETSDDSGGSSFNREALSDLKESIQKIYDQHTHAQSSHRQNLQETKQNQPHQGVTNVSNQSDSCESSTPTITQTPPRLDVDD